MGRRIDWWDDPAAPAITSVRPSSAAYVLDESGARVLLICRNDNGNWSMPGGAMDPGESMTGCAVRETREETGVEVVVTGLGGIWTDPRHRLEYTSDGEVRQEFTVVYVARAIGGVPTPSSESVRVEWVGLDRIAELPMDRSQRMRLDWMRRGVGGPYFDPGDTAQYQPRLPCAGQGGRTGLAEPALGAGDAAVDEAAGWVSGQDLG